MNSFGKPGNIPAPNTYNEEDNLKETKLIKVNIQGSLLDDIRVDEHGRHFLPS